jgi:hypothetical protein
MEMTSQSDAGRGTPIVGDTLREQAATPIAEGAEVAPGVVLDPETRQPMTAEAGADTPPTAPADMLGLPADDAPNMEQPDDLLGPPS